MRRELSLRTEDGAASFPVLWMKVAAKNYIAVRVAIRQDYPASSVLHSCFILFTTVLRNGRGYLLKP